MIWPILSQKDSNVNRIRGLQNTTPNIKYLSVLCTQKNFI